MPHLSSNARLVVVALALTVVAACGSQPPTMLAAVESARLERRLALDAALAAVDAAAPYQLAARFNPAPCTCPDFEVRYLGDWHRVYLSGSSAELSSLRAQLDGAPPAAREATVIGTPTGSLRQLNRETQAFEVFELERVVR